MKPDDMLGDRIAAARRARRLTQPQLANAAHVSLSLLRKVEQGSRPVTEHALDAIAGALGIEPDVLAGRRLHSNGRVHAAVPAMRVAIDAYDLPDDGPVRPFAELNEAVEVAVRQRLASQYTCLAESLPPLLTELVRAQHTMDASWSRSIAGLLANAYRAADAVAYKCGYHDLSARLIELMRRAAEISEDPALIATAAYVRTEVFFAGHNLAPGLRLLENALDSMQTPSAPSMRAAVGALHMRAAVVAARMASDSAAVDEHFLQARRLADGVPEGIYNGTAFGPVSLHVHELSVAVEQGEAARAVEIADAGKSLHIPLDRLPAERHSHYYIDVGRAQLWSGMRDEAFQSLLTARQVAPQHVREHPYVRDALVKLIRLHSRPPHALLAYAEWARAL